MIYAAAVETPSDKITNQKANKTRCKIHERLWSIFSRITKQNNSKHVFFLILFSQQFSTKHRSGDPQHLFLAGQEANQSPLITNYFKLTSDE